MFRKLEERLLRPDVRSSAEELDKLLADESIEFGSSGRVFNKEQIIGALAYEQAEGYSPARTAEDVAVRYLATDVALVTYRTVRQNSTTGPELQALRSSIWKRVDRTWRIIFHQGTPIGRAV
jgi:hypothetical protein